MLSDNRVFFDYLMNVLGMTKKCLKFFPENL